MSSGELPRPPEGSGKDDPGVPEALPRIVRLVGKRLGSSEIDRLWLFPPLKHGRRESGLVAVSCFEADDETRRLVTASYVAERTGKGLTLDPVLREEGSAPPEIMPRVIAGVVMRANLALGDPREIAVERSSDAFDALMEEFDPSLLDEEPVT